MYLYYTRQKHGSSPLFPLRNVQHNDESIQSTSNRRVWQRNNKQNNRDYDELSVYNKQKLNPYTNNHCLVMVFKLRKCQNNIGLLTEQSALRGFNTD
jgi:hypothetical protein